MYVGYAFYYFTRKSFTFAMPALIQLGFDKGQLGDLASILAISYGLSKFISGVVADKSNPRYFMGFGLMATGLLNIFFGMSSSMIFFAIFWGLNGWFQGWGWPPCAKLLTHWYSQSERGRWWGVWNTSHNLGGALIPLLAAFLLAHYGWRSALYVPGVICIVMGIFVILCLRDTPRSMGLPDVEKWRGEEVEEEYKHDEEAKPSTKEILFKYVLKNRYIWMLAIAYFFVYILRTALNDWAYLFLHQAKGFSLLAAGSGVFWFEIGGFIGSLVAGWASDTVFRGRRGPINVIFSVGVFFSLIGLWHLGNGMTLAMSALMFSGGFFVFGPQMLIGMAAAELSHKKAAGTATGFIGWVAYVGVAAAGGPLGRVAENFGWQAFFYTICGCAVIAVLLLLPLWSARNHPKYAKP
ncbi:MAG: Membrane sensor protein UhpC [Chlamydiia bacterium]|nr:Membrane sensor protein UhpC [Chlamydiia bacterium]